MQVLHASTFSKCETTHLPYSCFSKLHVERMLLPIFLFKETKITILINNFLTFFLTLTSYLHLFKTPDTGGQTFENVSL